MKIRITAAFAATDGSMPENIDVEIEDGDAGPGVLAVDTVVQVIGFAIDRMVALPARRYAAPAMAMSAPVRSLVRSCARTACGCPQDSHGSRNDRGIEMGAGNGACLVCVDGDKCRSYVAPSGAQAVKA